MKKISILLTMLFVAVFSSACINDNAIQELNKSAQLSMSKGDYQSAIADLNACVKLRSRFFETYYNLGVAYIEVKDFQKAIDTLNKAINIDAERPDTYYSLAVAQEGYADSLLNVDEEKTIQLSEEGIKQTDPYKNLSNETKEEMIRYYSDSISSYKKFEEIVNSPNKTEEIKLHIAEIEKVLEKLGYTESSF